MNQKPKGAFAKARRALAAGYTVSAAAAKAGVNRDTLHEWLRKSDTLRRARDEGNARLESAVLKDAKKDGRLALDVLSRRSRSWQRKDHMSVDAKIKISGTPKTREEAAAQIAAMAEALRPEETE